MVNKWIIVSGALGLIALNAGCGSLPQDPQGAPEITGTTAQADDASIWKSYGINANRFNASLTHVEANASFFSLQYARLGSSLGNPMYSYSGNYNFGGFDAGTLYGFQAGDCSGRPFGAAASCSSASPALNLYSPHPNTQWTLLSGYTPDQGAYPAGYYRDGDSNTAVPLCAAPKDNDVYIGYARDGACHIGVGGSVYSTDNAVVFLSATNGAHFKSYARGLSPLGAVVAGRAEGAPLYACQASYSGGSVPGWSRGSTCNVASYEGNYVNAPIDGLLVTGGQGY